MRLRQHLFPRTATDIGCVVLLTTFIPITFLFQMFIVLPECHDVGPIYIATWIVGLFVLFNILSNMLFCVLVDTSIKFTILTPPTKTYLRQKWHYCAVCEALVPPRSKHCKICRTCILKRDHHCHFTGCCVGHQNQRYFLMFMVYIAIGSAYAAIYNSYYIWWLRADTFINSFTAIKMVCPMLMLVLDVSWDNLYLLIYELNVIACAYSTILIIHHSPAILDGAMAHERNASKYNLGTRRNLEMVLGKRINYVWLSPWIKSELPHDGIHWENMLLQSTKNR